MDFWADRLHAPPPLPLYEECFRCARIVPKVACGSAPGGWVNRCVNVSGGILPLLG